MSFVNKRVKYYPRYITDTSVISAITNPANWGSAMFTDPGVILDSIYPGQVYIGDDYRYEFNGLVLKRNLNYIYWDCTNVIPDSAATFDTDGTVEYVGTDITLTWDSINKWMVGTITFATQRIQTDGWGVIGHTYNVKYMAKSPTLTDKLVTDMSSYYNNISVINNPNLSTGWQIYEFEGDAIFARNYLCSINLAVGNAIHFDNVLICDIT